MLQILVFVAAAAAGPKFTAGPDKAFNCTHYLGASGDDGKALQVAPGDDMTLTFPVDKVVKFKLAAKPSVKGEKVTFSLAAAPPGATLKGASFEWKVPKSDKPFEIDVVASEPAGETHWKLHIGLASDEEFVAWSAGMGSVWPDCEVPQWMENTVSDLDGDGRLDVTFKTKGATYDGHTEHITTMMIQRGAPMKFIKAVECTDCDLQPMTASDGTRLLFSESSCCCMTSVVIYAIAGATARDPKRFDLPMKESACHPADHEFSWEFLLDKQQRVTGLRVDTDTFAWDPATKSFKK